MHDIGLHIDRRLHELFEVATCEKIEAKGTTGQTRTRPVRCAAYLNSDELRRSIRLSRKA